MPINLDFLVERDYASPRKKKEHLASAHQIAGRQAARRRAGASKAIVAAPAKLSGDLSEKVRHAMALFDTNHSGTINSKYLGTVLRSVGMVPTAKELKQEEKALGDREMTLEELQAKTASYANKRADEKDLFLAFEQVFAYDAQGLCRNIKQARLEANLSEDELAAKANISVKAVQAYESGVVIPPSAVLERLNKVLNVQLDIYVDPAQVRRAAQNMGYNLSKAETAQLLEWIGSVKDISKSNIVVADTPLLDETMGIALDITRGGHYNQLKMERARLSAAKSGSKGKLRSGTEDQVDAVLF